MAVSITAKTIVEQVVEDMVIDHLDNHGLDPESSIIYLSRAAGNQQAMLRFSERIVFIGTDDPMDLLSADQLSEIELASFRRAGVDDGEIVKGTERAMLAVLMYTYRSMGKLMGLNN